MHQLSKALRTLRVFHDVKQSELAERLNVSRSYLSEIETGRKPSLDLLDKYANFFEIPLSSLLLFAESLDSENRAERIRSRAASKIIALMEWIDQKSREPEAKEK